MQDIEHNATFLMCGYGLDYVKKTINSYPRYPSNVSKPRQTSVVVPSLLGMIMDLTAAP